MILSLGPEVTPGHVRPGYDLSCNVEALTVYVIPNNYTKTTV